MQALFTGVRGIGILRTSPFGNSRKFATRKQPQATAKIRCLGDVPYLTLLVRYLPRSGRGPEPRRAEGGHLGAWGASSATGCLLSPCGLGEEGIVVGVRFPLPT